MIAGHSTSPKFLLALRSSALAAALALLASHGAGAPNPSATSTERPDAVGADPAETGTSPGTSVQDSVRGVTLSTHGVGVEWGSDTIVPTLRAIRDLGANWVAIHPYAGIGADGTVRVWELEGRAEAGSTDESGTSGPEYLLRPIREAHRLGLKILIKPHLAYWGSPFTWRGEIRFQSQEEWQRFWQGYREWIVFLAAATREADAFAVGTELDQMLDQEQQWRELIAAVREVSPAPLTYAANWPDFERVPFWDALDAIGIQAYFPVAPEGVYEESAIRQGWAQLMGRLRTYAEAQGRDIVLTELGYNRSFAAASKPWEYHTDGPEAEALQRLCTRVALEAIEAEPRVVGSFLWKWFPEPHPVGRNFQLASPGMREEIRRTWAGAAAVVLPKSR